MKGEWPVRLMGAKRSIACGRRHPTRGDYVCQGEMPAWFVLNLSPDDGSASVGLEMPGGHVQGADGVIRLTARSEKRVAEGRLPSWRRRVRVGGTRGRFDVAPRLPARIACPEPGCDSIAVVTQAFVDAVDVNDFNR